MTNSDIRISIRDDSMQITRCDKVCVLAEILPIRDLPYQITAMINFLERKFGHGEATAL